MRRGMIEWEELSSIFTCTFEFVDDHPSINASLQVINTNVFEDIHVSMTSFNQSNAIVQHWMEFFNVMGELDDDDPCDVNILESKGTHAMKGFGISSDQFLNLLKVNKVNTGSQENPKFANIGDYYDDETVGKIRDLLHEF